ncbi:ABC transporter substrate-binding protein [Streptomyces sp. NBC_00448]|uniref:ABC transporter substrate-binding protein n=1 Tax=Streptomyces sp. NBC_00448 TaxID=2903652 RepID=UPI002E1FC32F
MPETSRRAFAAAVTALAAGPLLAGCGRVVGGKKSSGGSAKGSFTFWSSWSEGEPQQKVLAQQIAAFTKDTGIKVDVQWGGRDVFAKISPTLNAGTTPFDLIDGAQRNVRSVLVSTGNALSLNDVLGKPAEGETQPLSAAVKPAYTDLVTTGGDTWMIPYEVASSGFWFNAAAHPDVAANPPKTWDELTALFQKAKAAGRAPIAQDGDIALYNLYYFAELVVNQLGPGKLRAAAGDKTGDALKDPAILAAAQRIEELVTKHYFAPGYSSSKFPALQQKWAAGKADFLYCGSWIPSETASYLARGFKPGFFPMPNVAAGDGGSPEAYLIGFTVPKKAARATEAKQFISYFMNKQRLAAIATDTANLTPRWDVAAPAVLAGVQKNLDAATKPLHGQYDGLVDYQSDWTTKVLEPLVNSLLFGKTSAKDFAAKLPEQSAAYWSNNG